ncbi:hypothetical protein [Allokutzneria albata]|uniref:Uncharacterized protein n=1 Tax=Allokutzneria albata TaxID=211114 RepID=A0A1H0CBN0_ALLAB|nr:hypothetical protein [Allokutzneria albata]SDN55288.1 hypothetical protein SAMN04489726_7133 [Allokutzneria albata]
MALTDIPVHLGHYRLMVTEAPTVKMRESEGGVLTPVTNREGEEQYMVVLFAKPRPQPGKRPGKGEEIKVNLPGDPGEDFEEGSYVELVNPVINTYEMRNPEGRITASGLWFKADGLKPVISAARSAA